MAAHGKCIKVKLLRGRFADSNVSPDARVTIDGKDVGVPSEVNSPGAVSYKELVSTTAAEPKWYTCHWWGMKVAGGLNWDIFSFLVFVY